MNARLLLALALLPGCTLVDQTTFDPEAGKRPVIAPAAVAAAPPAVDPAALMTIRFPQAPTLEADVAKAVAAARARKPDVVFEVAEITAGAATPGLGANAAAVARLITAQHVPANRVHLMLRAEAGASGNEVRVYVH